MSPLSTVGLAHELVHPLFPVCQRQTVMGYVGTFRLVEALQAEGFPLPDNVREARLVMGVNAALMLQYDCYVSQEHLVKLGRALVRLAEDGPQVNEKVERP